MTGRRATRGTRSCAALFCTALFTTDLVLGGIDSEAQARQPAPASVIHVTSRLVVLDVSVLNKKGVPVVSGLTRGDFTIREDGRPQSIVSFEAPTLGQPNAETGAANPLLVFS